VDAIPKFSAYLAKNIFRKQLGSLASDFQRALYKFLLDPAVMEPDLSEGIQRLVTNGAFSNIDDAITYFRDNLPQLAQVHLRSKFFTYFDEIWVRLQELKHYQRNIVRCEYQYLKSEHLDLLNGLSSSGQVNAIAELVGRLYLIDDHSCVDTADALNLMERLTDRSLFVELTESLKSATPRFLEMAEASFDGR
jgi:hypothetical protein